ncbi:hypothetical protein [Streptomyces sp. CC224B]|uniref:hypothetical protein n=1 Tax=Streptomyces sp. CC224B TaxID=3044571 RepID=UPI0024A92ADA|nr:hypothetical protein [Streptomyces sp. CC224B]
MIALHDVHEQGNDTVKAAVHAFGALHLTGLGGPDAEPDWKLAEKHFTQVIETIMGTAVPLSPGSRDGIVRRAENAAVGFLPAAHTRHYRCPICTERQRPGPPL